MQGSYCSSCYVHIAISQIESDAIRLLGKTYVLSRQQPLDCGNVGGCAEGYPSDVLKYIANNGGLMAEADYPYSSLYSSSTGACQYNANKVKIGVRGWYVIGGYKSNEEAIAAYVQSVGPVIVALYGNPLLSYRSGILSVCSSTNDVNHGVQVVGVLPSSSGGYWCVVINMRCVYFLFY